MNTRKLLILASFAALGLVILANIGRFQEFGAALESMQVWVLGIVVMVQLFSYYSNAKYYQSFFAIYGYHVPTKRLFRVSLVINFVNQVFPSAGVSGASFLTRSLAEDDIPAGKTTLAQLMRYGFTFISYVIILSLGFLLLFLGNNLNPITIRFTLLLIMGIIVACIVGMVLASDRDKIRAVTSNIVQVINKIVGWFRRRKRKGKPFITEAQHNHFIEEFYQGYEVLLEEKGQWRRPLFYSFTGSFAEVMTIFVVFLAFGRVINLGAIIAAYTFANVLSLISPITGGAGVYEAIMVATLAALGVPFTVAFSGVLVYRFFNFAFFLPIGFYYYRKTL